jgi:hypothetical protein
MISVNLIRQTKEYYIVSTTYQPAQTYVKNSLVTTEKVPYLLMIDTNMVVKMEKMTPNPNRTIYIYKIKGENT